MVKRIRWDEMDKTNIPFKQLRAEFAVYNKTTGKSPRTVSWYELRLELFERYLGDTATLTDVTIPTVRGFVVALQERAHRNPNNPFFNGTPGPLSSSYIQGFVRALRAFASWLHEDGYTTSNVLQNLKPPRVQQKVVEVLTDAEVERVVGIFDRDEAFGARNLAMVWTLLDCGLRASELCGLRIEDAHLAQGYLKVLGKGNKERLVPIGRACQEALLRWRDRFRGQFLVDDTTSLFLNANGEPMSVEALQEIVKRAAKRSGVVRMHCHLLRHTFATNYLVKEIGDPLRLQLILGHSSLEMVRRYVSIANVQQSLIEAHNSPMDMIIGERKPSSNSRRLQPRRGALQRLKQSDQRLVKKGGRVQSAFLAP